MQCFRNNLECSKEHKHCTYNLGCRHVQPLHSHMLQSTFYKLLLKNAQPTTQYKSGPVGYDCSIYLAVIIINSLNTLLKKLPRIPTKFEYYKYRKHLTVSKYFSDYTFFLTFYYIYYILLNRYHRMLSHKTFFIVYF